MTLDQWLILKNMTNAEFGLLVDLSEASVSRIRRGEQNASAEAARRIVAATKNAVTFNEIFGEAS